MQQNLSGKEVEHRQLGRNSRAQKLNCESQVSLDLHQNN